jgi:uncharacterized protein (DUF1697 family)
MRYVALLRAVNLGGNSKIAMTDLRSVLGGLGYADVATYLQSGNAVFSGRDEPPAKVAEAVASGLLRRLGLDAAVLVRTAAEVADAIRRSPLPGPPENPSRYFTAFLAAQPEPARAHALASRSFGPDRIWVSGREAYLWCPNGAAHTPLTNSFVEKSLGVAATSRNWNTVQRLAAMASG